MRQRAAVYASRDGRVADDEFFFAEQNARLVKNAEEYYRSMFRGRVNYWNKRDMHVADTLTALVSHLSRQGLLACRSVVLCFLLRSCFYGWSDDSPGRPVGTITHLRVPGGSGAMGAAIKFSTYLGSMSDDAAAAMRARGRQGLDRAFEAIEDMGFIPHLDGERFVVIISA